MSDHARETEHVPPSAAPGARASGPRETNRLIEDLRSHASMLRNFPGVPDTLCAAANLLAASSGEAGPLDLVQHLHRQRMFSERTFGPSARTAGVVDHIRKELREVEAKPHDLSEWIDVVILGLDGAWRSGHTPEEIVAALA